MQSLNLKILWENIYFQVGIISKLASYFVPTTLFFLVTTSKRLAYCARCTTDCFVVAFQYRIISFNTFVRAFVVFERAVPYPTSLHPVSVLILHPIEIQFIIMWSQTVR